MEQTVIIGVLAVLGLLFGSFAGATVWRLRARQLVEDEADGETIDVQELKRLKKLTKRSFQTDRSQCLHCGHQLAWYDLVPLFSWMSLRGRCRYCKQRIGWLEPLLELSMAGFFVISYLSWPYALDGLLSTIIFGLWLIAGVGLLILLGYDARWFLLPNKVMFPVIGVACVSAFLQVVASPDPIQKIVSVFLGCVILSGLYFVLYIASKGRWIGFGDIKLGLALALLLADWRLALLALFSANFIGTIIALPGLVTKKLGRASRIPFGPMLIGGWLIAGLWGDRLIMWYLTTLLGL